MPDVLTPRDLIAFLPMGRNAVYDALRTRAIKSVRVGQKLLITKAALREFLGGNVE
ncbi:MAG: helix-turn-helix domain-containing protein [Candidatus Cybelea sp.]